jgi:hypothetical protein
MTICLIFGYSILYMTLTKKLFGISGLAMLIISSFGGIWTFAQSSSQITINNDLFLDPSQTSPYSISVCINGVLEKTITTTGKTIWDTTPGAKHVKLLVNQIDSISCVEVGSKQFEVYEDYVTLESGTNTTFDMSGEPIIRGIKSHQSMKAVETLTNPGGNSILTFSPTEGSIFDKVCIDGVVAPQARYREYFVAEGKHVISLATPSGECDSTFHFKLEVRPTTTTKIEVTNFLDYSEAYIKGVEVFDDVEDIHAVKNDDVVVHPAIATPVKVQAVPTKLATAQVANKSLPRSGGVENLILICSGVMAFSFVGYKNLKRKSMKIDV